MGFILLDASTALHGMTNSNPYPEKLIGKPLHELLNGYHQIELEIIGDLVNCAQSALVSAGFERRDQNYVRKNLHLSILVEFVGLMRILHLKLQNVGETDTYHTRTATINHFGLIREIHIEAPRHLDNALEGLCNRLRTMVTQAYTALEQAFISSNADLEMKVFRRLYDCVEAQLKNNNKYHLFGRCWFFISEIEEGFYFFNESVLRRVIEHYKLHQDEAISPLELTVWILSAPLPFQKSLAIEAWRQKKFLSLEWVKTRYIDEANKIFQAEIKLFDSKTYTSTTLCERRGYYLVLAMPTELKDRIVPEIMVVKGALEKQFEDGLKEWSPYIRMIRKLSGLAKESTSAPFVGQAVGYAIKTLLAQP
ncbi:MAG: hypothetical protein PHX83_03845 [Acidobacteriia bacterium]|nr:hypothetical protein [Terriglobia bacterium]